MNAPSYRLGAAVVAATVLLSLALTLTFVGPYPPPARAAQDTADLAWPLGTFRLTERSGRTVTDADLADRVAVVSFIFTRCRLTCPKITSVMKSLQGTFAGTGVQLVSLSVDPEHDTPEVLAQFARRYSADPDRWWFLSGPKAEVLELIRGRFKLGVEVAPAEAVQAGAEDFTHSERLALVRHNRVLGYYDSNDPKAVADLVRRARTLAPGFPGWVGALPAVNASLNATCAVLLVVAWAFIRRGNWRAHAATMAAAVAVSALFLTCYLVYHAQAGSTRFLGTGAPRVVYFTVLLSHTLLATLGVVPLVVLTLRNAWLRRFDRHGRVAAVTLPVWLYVSVTGVIIYLMLYQWPVGAATAS